MAAADDVVQEILKDLDGILMLNAWETTLLRGVREKAATLIDRDAGNPPTPNGDCSGADPDCTRDGGDSAV